MKKMVLIFILLSMVFVAYGLEEEPKFAGLEWGTTIENAIMQMKERDYKLEINKDNQYLLFSGHLFNETSVIILRFIEGKLQKVTVQLKPVEVDLIPLYSNIKTKLEAKYGICKSMDSFLFPYEMGDGHEITALSLGKGSLLSIWEVSKGNKLYSLALLVEKDLKIQIWYESPEYSEYMQKKNSDDDL